MINKRRFTIYIIMPTFAGVLYTDHTLIAKSVVGKIIIQCMTCLLKIRFLKHFHHNYNTQRCVHYARSPEVILPPACCFSGGKAIVGH